MIRFELFDNIDHNDCSYCGKFHHEMIELKEESHAGGGNNFILSRRCAKKLLGDLAKFIQLHPSGQAYGKSIRASDAAFRAQYTNDPERATDRSVGERLDIGEAGTDQAEARTE